MNKRKRNRARVLRAKKSARYDFCEHGHGINYWERCPKCRAYIESARQRWEEFEKSPEWQARWDAAKLHPDGLLFPEDHVQLEVGLVVEVRRK